MSGHLCVTKWMCSQDHLRRPFPRMQVGFRWWMLSILLCSAGLNCLLYLSILAQPSHIAPWTARPPRNTLPERTRFLDSHHARRILLLGCHALWEDHHDTHLGIQLNAMSHSACAHHKGFCFKVRLFHQGKVVFNWTYAYSHWTEVLGKLCNLLLIRSAG